MNEQPEFIGRSYEEEEKAKLKSALDKWSAEGTKPLEGELEKTEEELKTIVTVNAMIMEELHSIGIEDYQPLPPEKVHFLSGEVFKKKFPDFDGNAFFLSTSDAIYVDKDTTDSKARVFYTLIHEFIHRASTKKFYAKGRGVYDARTGYHIRSLWKNPNRERRLLGFNEIMNDYTVFKIMVKNQELLKDFGVSKEDIKGPIYGYMRYSTILELIVKKIAADKKITGLQAFKDLERGQFQKNILVLKNIERAFGKGALHVLSLLGTLGNEDSDKHLGGLIKQFFSENDESKRAEIQQEINKFAEEQAKETN